MSVSILCSVLCCNGRYVLNYSMSRKGNYIGGSTQFAVYRDTSQWKAREGARQIDHRRFERSRIIPYVAEEVACRREPVAPGWLQRESEECGGWTRWLAKYANSDQLAAARQIMKMRTSQGLTTDGVHTSRNEGTQKKSTSIVAKNASEWVILSIQSRNKVIFLRNIKNGNVINLPSGLKHVPKITHNDIGRHLLITFNKNKNINSRSTNIEHAIFK